MELRPREALGTAGVAGVQLLRARLHDVRVSASPADVSAAQGTLPWLTH